MNKCNRCPHKASCTIEPSTCYAPTNYTISLSKVKTEKEIRADERAKTIHEVNALIQTRLIDNLALDTATKYGNKSAKQQANSYATVMKYEIADCVDDLLDDLEQLKEEKND